MRQWVTKQCHADLQQVADRYHISPVFAEVLVKRGLYSWKEMDAYLFEDMAQMHAPEQMTGLVQAADILFDKIQQNEKIRVIGDYDVDGVMSTYILCRGLERLGAKVSYTIPHRERDGYGMRAYMADNAYEEGARTIVTCDNGISAKDAVARAKELGMTVVLTDHHEVPTEQEVEILPDADVIVDPKQSKETYPFHELCGAGVAYKLMQYMYEKKGISKQVEELLPFAAIATVCDVVPLQEENRLLVRRGLEALPTTSNIGLQALLQQLQFEKKVTSMDLGFRVGPCINAPGRLVDATISLELFLEKDPAAARTKATKLVELNEERKDITRIATEQAVKEIEQGEIPRVLVVYLPDCHESVAGIVAGRLRERYYRPTYVLTDSKGRLKGSGRSIPGYHMQQELQACKEHLVEFGGHAMAAGFSLEKEELEHFRQALEEHCTLESADLVEKVYFDKVVALRELDVALVQQLEWMEPVGEQNPAAVFAKADAVISSVRMCGKEMHIAQVQFEEDGKRYSAVDFHGEEGIGKAICERYGIEAWEQLKNGGARGQYRVDLLFAAEINDRYGSLQLRLIDCQ